MRKFLRSLFFGSNSIKGASLILMVTSIASNILGLFRNRFLAQKIPPTDLDTYLAAFRIPDLVFNLLIAGAVFSAFVPIFISYLRKNNEKEAWYIANSIINISILSLLICCGLLAIFMPYLMPKIVPGFSAAEKIQTTNIARILLLTPFFFSLSYIFGGILNSYKKFVAYSLTPLIYNLSIIVGTILFADKYSVYGVAASVVVGSFLHMAIQIPTVKSLGYYWQAVLDFKHTAVKRIGKLIIPRVIGLGASQIVLIFATFLASLWVGNVTYFNFANDIQTFFSIVFGASFAIAVFPFLADFAADHDEKKFLETFSLTAKQILYFIIPFSILLILLRVEIVRLILGTGHFGWTATVITANNLGAFAIGLWATSLVQLLARAFYAREDTRTPAFVGVISAVFTIIMSFILSKSNFGQIHLFNFIITTPLKSVGISLAVSLGAILNAIILIVILKRRVGNFDGGTLAWTIGKFVIFSLIIGVIAQVSKMVIGSVVNMQTFFGVFIKTTSVLIISLGFYVLFTYLARCEELSALMAVFKKKVTPPDDLSINQPTGPKQSQEE